MLWENIRQALNNFKSGKLRTGLSLLGIMIGVTAVILITTLGKSATANVQKEIASQGMDIINVYKGWPSQYKPAMYSPEVGKLAAERVGGIKRVSPVVTVEDGNVKLPDRSVFTEIHGVRPDFFDINRIGAIAGELFPLDQPDYSNDHVILGYGAAQVLFPMGGGTGQKIIIEFANGSARQYKVLGILEDRGRSIMENFNESLYIPYENYNRKINRVKTVNRWIFQTENPQQSKEINTKLTRWFKGYGQEEETYFFLSASSIADTFKSVTGTLNIVLASIAAISLLVGGIGIMNIMLVSVTERIREIGIRMSLGAAPSVIRKQFLTEAVCLTFIGGILGIALGAFGGWVITRILKWSFTFSVPIYLFSAGFSVVVGLFFGLFPAIRASQLNPIEALSRE